MRKKSRFFIRPTRVILCLLLLVAFLPVVPAAAKESFNSYLYDSENKVVSAPDAVQYTMGINEQKLGVKIGKIVDIVCDSNGLLYILDNENARIFVCDQDGNPLRIIEKFLLEGKEDHFLDPRGLFVTLDSALYVADTGNKRIVELDQHGQGVRAIYEPKSALIGADFGFKPAKLAIDSVGQIYVVSADYTNGLIVLDMDGEYLRSMGVPKVAVNLVELFWKSISTKEQLAQMEQSVPTEFNNVAVDERDFLYVTCSTYSIWDFIDGENVSIKKMNAKGDDILRESAYGNLPYGDVEIALTGAYPGGSMMTDVISLGSGMFGALDANRNKVFVYNGDSNLLFTFGSPGTALGTFQNPVALAFGNDRFYVADGKTGNVSVFTPTAYGKNLLKATRLNDEGDYEQEAEVWQEILNQNANNTIALTGLARTAYNNGNYAESMRYFKQLGDTENYSKAFYIVRRDYLQSNTWVFMLIAFGILALVIVTSLVKRRVAEGHGIKSPLFDQIMFSRKIIFRPLSGFWDLTRENKGSLPAALILLGVGTVIMLFNTYATGYIFTGSGVQKTLILVPILQLPLLVLVLSLCNWCVSSLMDGKGTFKNILMTNCYALTPVLLLYPPAIILSNVLAAQEASIYQLLIKLAIVWVALLIMSGNKQVHDYSMSKSLLVLLITVLLVVILLFLSILLYFLVQQMVAFAADMLRDIAILSN